MISSISLSESLGLMSMRLMVEAITATATIIIDIITFFIIYFYCNFTLQSYAEIPELALHKIRGFFHFLPKINVIDILSYLMKCIDCRSSRSG